MSAKYTDQDIGEMCMNRDVPRASKGRRAATIGLVALFATGIWWIILHFGGRAFGSPIEERWLFALLGGIYLLLVLGLSMAAMAERGIANGVQDTRREGVAEPPAARRKSG
jgi:hypothetical protein